MTTTPPQDQPTPPEGFGIDTRIGAATLMALAASWEDSRPHAILKLQPRNSFDYRVRYEPQLKNLSTYKVTKSFLPNEYVMFIVQVLSDMELVHF